MSKRQKIPGSRRYRAENVSYGRDEFEIHPGALIIEFRFVCARGHEERVAGRFQKGTSDSYANDPAPGWWAVGERGNVPSDPQREGRGLDHAKALLLCPDPRCRNERQIHPDRLTAAFDAVWQPNVRRVITRPINDPLD